MNDIDRIDINEDIHTILKKVLLRIKEKYNKDFTQEDKKEISFETYQKVCLFNLNLASKEDVPDFKIGDVCVADVIKNMKLQKIIDCKEQEIKELNLKLESIPIRDKFDYHMRG